MVERSLSMREVPGSIPGASRTFRFTTFYDISKITSSEIKPGPPAGHASTLP